MAEGEDIQALQEEVQRLNEQLRAQYYQLQNLQQRLTALGAPPPSAPRAAVTKKDEDRSIENFVGLRLIHLVGIVVLVIGLSIGVKYAIDKQLISEGARIGLAYAAAGALLFLSCAYKLSMLPLVPFCLAVPWPLLTSLLTLPMFIMH